MKSLESRKWQLTIFFSIVTTVALFTGHIASGEFMGIAMALIGVYNAANVLGKKYGQKEEK